MGEKKGFVRSHRLGRAAGVAAALLATACTAPDELPEVELGQAEAPLYGTQAYDDQCSSTLIDFHQVGVRFGRIASASRAFEQCVEGAMRGSVLIDTDDAGPYKQCGGDPAYGTGVTNQIDRLLHVARSPNDLHVNCTGGASGADASAGIGDYGTDGTEAFSWTDGRLKHYWEQIGSAEFPRPWAEVAGITWHEVMHQHGYRHSNDDEAATDSGCGYGAGQYSRWDNSIPYIVGRCMVGTLVRSGRSCGFTSCGDGGRMMIDRFDPADSSASAPVGCTCVEDPRDDEIGLITFDNRLHDLAMEGVGDALSGTADAWKVRAGDAVQAVADLNGDGKDDVVLTGTQGLAVARYHEAGHQLYAYAKVADGDWIGGWRVHGTDKVAAVADLDGDGRDEVVLRSTWGLGVIGLDSSGKLRSLGEFANGTAIGNWTLSASDQLVGAGDVNGDKREELVVRGASGVGVLWLHPTLAKLSLYKRLDFGTDLGAWTFASSEGSSGVADFDADGRVDLLFKGNAGLAVVKLVGTEWSLLSRVANGTTLYTWTLAATDVVRGVADFTGDGRPDVLLSNASGWGLLYRPATAWALHSRLPYGTSPLWLDSTAQVRALGDFDGNKRADVLVSEVGGVSLLWVDASGTWRTLARNPFGDNDPGAEHGWGDTGYFMLGSWPLYSDNDFVYTSPMRFDPRFRGVGDFDGDGRADVVIMD